MRLFEPNKLLSVVGIPFLLAQWQPVTLYFKGTPKIQVQGNQLTVQTQESAGGYAYFLPEAVFLDGSGSTLRQTLPTKLSQKSLSPSPYLRLQWDWRIGTFPTTTHTVPLRKANEDFALRMGVLITDGTSRIDLPSKFSRELEKRKQKLSYVVFYCASDSVKQTVCTPSPHNSFILDCILPSKEALGKSRSVSVTPLKDLAATFRLSDSQLQKQKAFGVWIFADSDDSHSKSEASIQNIRWN